jgi:hypothetical protein
LIDRARPEGGRRAFIRRVAHDDGRFGETGPLDNLEAGGSFLSAQRIEDMTERRTSEKLKIALDQHSPSESRSTSPNRARITAS